MNSESVFANQSLFFAQVLNDYLQLIREELPDCLMRS